jgi:hypothetical protein
MGDEKITTESVSFGVAETDPIVLRDTGTRRLVFKAMIVDKPDAPVRGVFVWQRKRAADEWEDITGETLTKLKAGEGYALELHSDEVATLLNEIEARKGIYESHGVVSGRQDYLADKNLPEVVRQILEKPDSELASALKTLDPAALLSFGRSVDLSKLDALLAEWDENEEAEAENEDFWQDVLTRNSWVFSQLTGSPVVLLQDKAYMGGKDISNVGGGYLDYLVRNELTDNVSLVEIKTPAADLLGTEYRSGTYPPGREVGGGLVQVLGYRDTFLHEIRTLRPAAETFQAYNPRCYVVAGQVASFGDDDGRKKSFELFRTAQAGVQIIAFDEIRARLQSIRDVLAVDNEDDESGASDKDLPIEIPSGTVVVEEFRDAER